MCSQSLDHLDNDLMDPYQLGYRAKQNKQKMPFLKVHRNIGMLRIGIDGPILFMGHGAKIDR